MSASGSEPRNFSVISGGQIVKNNPEKSYNLVVLGQKILAPMGGAKPCLLYTSPSPRD